jgi:hypothetical protein
VTTRAWEWSGSSRSPSSTRSHAPVWVTARGLLSSRRAWCAGMSPDPQLPLSTRWRTTERHSLSLPGCKEASGLRLARRLEWTTSSALSRHRTGTCWPPRLSRKPFGVGQHLSGEPKQACKWDDVSRSSEIRCASPTTPLWRSFVRQPHAKAGALVTSLAMSRSASRSGSTCRVLRRIGVADDVGGHLDAVYLGR